MMFAYRETNGHLERLPLEADLKGAIWIDLLRPQPEQVAAVEALGVQVPTLADMEEIEISNRLYREDGVDYMTVVLPGLSTSKAAMSGPATFILSHTRLITVRHHAPRPFETFPARANRSTTGCTTPVRLFLGLVEEIIARFADLLEGTGRAIDTLARDVYADSASRRGDALADALTEVGRQGELLSRVRLGLLSVERMLGYYQATMTEKSEAALIKSTVKAHFRDIQALEVHGDFLENRVALITDVTLGMINLGQNQTVKIVSVVAVVFLPPTVIASAYGMNFANMPELDWEWGYPMAIALMVASAVGTYLFFKWKKWL
jgi:magnesium transporter